MWWDYFRLWNYALGTPDPLSKREHDKQITGAGVSQPDAIPDIRQDGSFWGGSRGVIRLRDTNDFVDLSSVSNRQSRYKEYERLRNVAEIETAMTVFADESCLAGPSIISTLFYGPQTIQWLAENKADEEFLVYSWDFVKGDYTLAWAYNPRLVKTDKTVKVMLDDGTSFISTADHRILLLNGKWTYAGQLAFGDELTPFYRLPVNPHLTKLKTNQFPRIYTNEGWKHERQFIEEWKSGEEIPEYQNVNKAIRLLAAGLTTARVAKEMDRQWKTIEAWIHKAGFSFKEIRMLGRKKDRRRVVGVIPWQELPVYDLSVREAENFCGESVVFHNCQTNDEEHVLKVNVKDKEVKEELEFLLFHLKMINIDKKIWNWAKNLYVFGDLFLELVTNLDNPKDGILKIQMLPPESMYRVETTKARLIEFQQSKEGVDQDSLTKAPITQATEEELRQSTAIRFHPEQVIHIRIGDDRKTFYPYGVSLIEAARGPAHQLRLMEDAMVVYRLTRAPERRVFYIDVGTLPPFKAEAFIDRMKDQFRKKKVASGKGGPPGASQVEERWHAPAQDEDYWIPIRQQSQTRIETLPGAQNLGEIDDAVYFRNKLFTAMNFPKNYFSNEDPQATRITLSAQDVKFARQIERLQSAIEDGMWEVCDRHLRLRGFPEEVYEDLKVKMTPPSDWRELSKAEVTTNRIQNANNLKGAQLFADLDIYMDWMKIPEETAKEKLGHLKIQKLEDLKLQVLAQNPILLGVATPPGGEQEIGAAPGGPNPMLGPPGVAPGGPPGAPPLGSPPPAFASDEGPPPSPASGGNATILADPTEDDIKKYDLDIEDYAKEMDVEEPDFSEV